MNDILRIDFFVSNIIELSISYFQYQLELI